MMLHVFAFAVASAGVSPELAPPSVLYHFGEQEHLIEDARLGNIPEDVWDGRIMGGGGRFGLLPFRRGLYGTIHPVFAENFGDYLIYAGKKPWFMAVHIKAECRLPENVAFVSKLPYDRRFGEWFLRAKPPGYPSLAGFISSCYRFIEGRPLAAVANVSGPGTGCEAPIGRFLAETNIKVVLDEALPDLDSPLESFDKPMSWYVRDRACVESIEATPRQVLNVIAAVPGFWRTHPDRSSSGATGFVVLVEALRGAGSVDPAVLNKIAASAAASDLTDHHGRFWVRESVPALTEAFQRCAHSPEFGKATALFLEQSYGPGFPAPFHKALKPFIDSIVRLCHPAR